MKKFIFTAPIQETLSMHKYDSDNPKLLYDGETAYPIIPVIANSVKEGEEIEIVAIVADSDDAQRNEEYFKRELDSLSQEKNFSYEIQELSIPSEESTEEVIKLFGDLIELISDEDELNADLTYGSKLMSIVLMMSLNFGYKLHEDVSIGHIVCGEISSEDTARIHNASPLFFMNNTVFTLAQSHVEDPVKVLRYMIEY